MNEFHETDFLVGLDVSIFRALNNFCGWSRTLDYVALTVENLKGALFMGILGLLWYWPGKEMLRRREALFTIIPVVALSLVCNRVISMLLPFRARPMYDIGANAPSVVFHADFEHWSSFPSDTATFLFAIAAGFWLVSRWSGLFFGVFAVLVGLARIFFGLHYPSDVLVGALIGIAISFAVNREPVRKMIVAPILTFEPRYPPYFYGLFFVVLAELTGIFPITRGVGMAVVRLFTGHNG
jgi:undecaprenyl-diphosphatase